MLVRRGQRSVLVVDDDDAVRSVLVQGLERGGYTVYGASDVGEAIHIVNSRLVSVAVIDKNLRGERSGVDLLRHVAAHLPYTKSIMLTGYASMESAVEAVRCGAYDYLTKPIDLKDLQSKVDGAYEAFTVACERDNTRIKYEHLFETVPGLVWFMTEDGVLRRINEAGANLLGYNASELHGRSYETLLAHEPGSEPEHWAFKERRTGGRATRGQLVSLETKDGEERTFEIYSTGTYESADATEPKQKQLWGTLGVALDVTEIMEMQAQLRQQQKMEALGRMASGVAHDFNNLLTVILGELEYAENPTPTALQNIGDAARRASDLTSKLLSFSRQEPFSPTRMSVSAVVDGTRSMLEKLLPEDVSLRLLSDGADDHILGDKGQLEQALMNLVVNAGDAMPDGGFVVVETSTGAISEAGITVHPDMQPGRYIRLSVKDTGVGMSANTRQHAFDPFYTTKAEGEGTGLGLAMVYGIVKQHGGYVSLRSDEGKGTEVISYLPAAPRPDLGSG